MSRLDELTEDVFDELERQRIAARTALRLIQDCVSRQCDHMSRAQCWLEIEAIVKGALFG